MLTKLLLKDNKFFCKNNIGTHDKLVTFKYVILNYNLLSQMLVVNKITDSRPIK